MEDQAMMGEHMLDAGAHGGPGQEVLGLRSVATLPRRRMDPDRQADGIDGGV
jgi:hypothetical protein